MTGRRGHNAATTGTGEIGFQHRHTSEPDAAITLDSPVGTPVGPFEILGVVDTREYIEVDEKWVAVPGSGDCRECDRCGSRHEIHVQVRDANGSNWTVGTGCADLDRSAANQLRSKALGQARTRHGIRAREEANERIEQLRADVERLHPYRRDIVHFEAPITAWNGGQWMVHGDARVLVHRDADLDERHRCLERDWHRRRFIEACGGVDEYRALFRRANRSSLDW